MDFGQIYVTTGGVATISPETGALTLSPGLQRGGGIPSPARYIGAATRLSLVIVRSSVSSVLLRRSGGPETLRLDNFSIDGSPIRIVGAGTFSFAIGGRLTVPAGAAEGVYVGDMEITVEYF